MDFFKYIGKGIKLAYDKLVFVFASAFYLAIAFLLTSLIIGFYMFLLSYATTFYSIFTNFISMLESLANGSGDGSCIAQNISYALSCTGILSGINNASPVLMSSFIFLMVSILKSYTIGLGKYVIDIFMKGYRILSQ